MRPPRAGIHTRRSALTSQYDRILFQESMETFTDLSIKLCENLFNMHTTSNYFRPLQTASNHFNQTCQTTPGPKCSVHQQLQATSTHCKRDVGDNKGFHHYLYNFPWPVMGNCFTDYRTSFAEKASNIVNTVTHQYDWFIQYYEDTISILFFDMQSIK